MEQLKIPMLPTNPINTEGSKESSDAAVVISRVVSKSAPTYFHTERLEAFCDAVLSIIATILVTSLKFSREQMADNDLSFLLLKQNSTFLIGIPGFFLQLLFFFAVFKLVFSAWYDHMKIFCIYPIADNFVLWLNIIFLLACSFLPLVATFLVIGGVPTVLALLFGSTLILALVRSTQILYGAFLISCVPSHSEIKPFDEFIIGWEIGSYFVTPVFLLLAFGFSYIDEAGPTIATFLVYFVIFGGPSVSAFYNRYVKRQKKDDFYLEKRRYANIISKTRVEFFTDGVFAIVATLLIIDTTADISDKLKDSNVNFQDSSFSEINDFANDSLYEAKNAILSYLMCFLLVCLFWYVNHAIFHYIRRMNNFMIYINTISLMKLCLIPFCASIWVGYSSRPGVGNLSVAITFTFITVFLIGLLQAIFWLFVRFWIHDVLTQRLNVLSDIQMIFRVFIIPTFSILFLFINSFSSHTTSLVTLYAFFTCFIPTLILIEFLHFVAYLIMKKVTKA